MVVVGLSQIPGAAHDRCEQFMKCLRDRIEYGPPEYRPPGEAEQRQVDVSDPIQHIIFRADISPADAKEAVAAAASLCDSSWHELYEFPHGT